MIKDITMAKATIVTGLILILIGVVGYLGSDSGSSTVDTQSDQTAEQATDSAEVEKPKGKSVTALIPAFLGSLLTVCGLLAMSEARRKLFMHIAVALGFLGFLAGAGRGAMGLGKFLSGDPALNQRSFLFVWLMAIVCAVFVFLCVQSFRNARKQQQVPSARVE